ncbi:MAG: radical SAM protein [Erysipelotrichaceae bacterium]|jgi:DNA repair photolyase|nr:radical SAM protein [Erysipelotrichaceae bacterium]
MTVIPAKQILIRTPQPNWWFSTDFNVNLYRGCTHGCIYCDSRSVCYGDPDFDTIKVKENALEILTLQMRKKRVKGVIMTGAMSDPYNPLEKKLQLTKGLLELCDFYRYGIAITTKSDLVIRDLELLTSISKHSPVLVMFSLSTVDESLSSWIEPKAPSPARRLLAMQKLQEAGIFTGVLLMPVLPFLEDKPQQIRDLVALCGQHGAKFIYPWFGVTMREGNREYFLKKLKRRDPEMAKRYQHRFGNSYFCSISRPDQMMELFKSECARYGILNQMQQIVKAYKKPKESPKSKQLDIFDYSLDG